MDIFRTETFNFAHRLYEDTGACGQLHGHTALVKLTVSGTMHERSKMIVPFDALKSTLKEVMVNHLDNATILDYADPLANVLFGGNLTELRRPALLVEGISYAKDLKNLENSMINNGNVVLLDGKPTSELIVATFLPLIVERLVHHRAHKDSGVIHTVNLEFWETPKCGASLSAHV